MGTERDVFGERSTISELLSEFYQCKQKHGQSLQDFSHHMMSKIVKVIKKDSKAIKDLNAAIPNQFVENVKEAWLRRDFKKE